MSPRKRIEVKPGRDLSTEATTPCPPTVMPARLHAVTRAPTVQRKVRRNGTRKKTVYLPDDLCRALRVHCAHEDASETEVVIAALRRYLGLS